MISGFEVANCGRITRNSLDKVCDYRHKYHMFKRRLGPAPHENGNQTPGLCGCPDLFELTSGDFAAIGRDLTGEARAHLPADASCGPDERIVQLPRSLLILAKRDIPDAL